MTIANNQVIGQLSVLLSSAINLKEKFDLKEDSKVLQAYFLLYNRELDELTKIIPQTVLNKAHLLRHTNWLRKNLSDGKPENSYQDILEICHTDIGLTQEYYLHYLTENDEQKDYFYNWAIIHPIIEKLAKPRFEAGHYADAVEASLKEINDIIKAEYKLRIGNEEDGADLMRKIFSTSPKNNFSPTVALVDNTTDSGKSIQEGYMNIFAGAMIGIRNPKAHANMEIKQTDAWEKIVLCSHLLKMWDNNGSV